MTYIRAGGEIGNRITLRGGNALTGLGSSPLLRTNKNRKGFLLPQRFSVVV